MRWVYPALALQGDLSQRAREQVMTNFRSGSAEILVATNVAARGLDFEDIGQVINFDLPDSEQSFTSSRRSDRPHGSPGRVGDHLLRGKKNGNGMRLSAAWAASSRASHGRRSARRVPGKAGTRCAWQVSGKADTPQWVCLTGSRLLRKAPPKAALRLPDLSALAFGQSSLPWKIRC